MLTPLKKELVLKEFLDFGFDLDSASEEMDAMVKVVEVKGAISTKNSDPELTLKQKELANYMRKEQSRKLKKVIDLVISYDGKKFSENILRKLPQKEGMFIWNEAMKIADAETEKKS